MHHRFDFEESLAALNNAVGAYTLRAAQFNRAAMIFYYYETDDTAEKKRTRLWTNRRGENYAALKHCYVQLLDAKVKLDDTITTYQRHVCEISGIAASWKDATDPSPEKVTS